MKLDTKPKNERSDYPDVLSASEGQKYEVAHRYFYHKLKPAIQECRRMKRLSNEDYEITITH